MKIDIVVIDDALAALALRGVLEAWGCEVRMHLIATPCHLVKVLGGETELSPHVVLMDHGAAEGLHLPELAPQIAAEQPYGNVLTPRDLAEFLKLPNRLVINTGCSLGTPDFVEVFLAAGCRAYIGATDDPDGSAGLFYPLHFFYELQERGSSIEEAHRKASAHNAETQMYQLHLAKP